MRFEDMSKDLWITHTNGLRASVLDVDDDSQAFHLLWETGTANWYGQQRAEEFSPVPLKVGS